MSRSTTARSRAEFLASRGAVIHATGQVPLHFGDPGPELDSFSFSAALVGGLNGSVLRHNGTDVLDLLHRLSTNDVITLEPGRTATTILTSERGRIIDLLNVVRLESGKFLLLSDSADAKPALEWIDRFTIIEDAEISDATGEFARFAIIGPDALSIIRATFDAELSMGDVTVTGETVLVASTWGELPRVDVMSPAAKIEQMWDMLVTAHAVPAGDSAFHTERISRGVPFPGAELTSGINPLEAGLKHLISFTKGCYVGQEVVARLDTYDKLQKRLAILEADAELTAGADLTVAGKRVGTVTSVAPLEASGNRLALGYVRRGNWDAGTKLECGDAAVAVRCLVGEADIP